MKKNKAEPTPPKTSDEQLADLMLQREQDRRDRIGRASKEIEVICQRERVVLDVREMRLIEGKLVPLISLIAKE